MESGAPEARLEPLVASSMAAALAVVLHFIRIFTLAGGGSVTLATALPIWVVARRYGLRFGAAAGATAGLVLLVLDGKISHGLSPLLDYPLAYGTLGLAALTSRPTVGATISVLARYAVHVTSGVLFFASSAPESLPPLTYSILYNLYVVPDAVIALALLSALQAGAPHLLGLPPLKATEKPSAALRMMMAGPLLMMGVGLVVVGLALWSIKSQLAALNSPSAGKTNASPSPNR